MCVRLCWNPRNWNCEQLCVCGVNSGFPGEVLTRCSGAVCRHLRAVLPAAGSHSATGTRPGAEMLRNREEP